MASVIAISDSDDEGAAASAAASSASAAVAAPSSASSAPRGSLAALGFRVFVKKEGTTYEKIPPAPPPPSDFVCSHCGHKCKTNQALQSHIHYKHPAKQAAPTSLQEDDFTRAACKVARIFGFLASMVCCSMGCSPEAGGCGRILSRKRKFFGAQLHQERQRRRYKVSFAQKVLKWLAEVLIRPLLSYQVPHLEEAIDEKVAAAVDRVLHEAPAGVDGPEPEPEDLPDQPAAAEGPAAEDEAALMVAAPDEPPVDDLLAEHLSDDSDSSDSDPPSSAESAAVDVEPPAEAMELDFYDEAGIHELLESALKKEPNVDALEPRLQWLRDHRGQQVPQLSRAIPEQVSEFIDSFFILKALMEGA